MAFDAPTIADALETVIKAALLPIVVRLKALEADAEAAAMVRERLATLEAKPAIPGPQGPAGANGVDGLGMADYTVEYDGERTFTHKWAAGEITKEITFKAPIPIYRGVFLDGKIYERGDMVTVSGSIYHCEVDTTSRPGNGSKDWHLAVKRGKDDRGGPWPR